MNRGPKPKKIINDKWSSELSYAVGLIVADGCLCNDGLLIDFTSKDKDQIINYLKCLNLNKKIGLKRNNKSVCFRVQFKNKIFYNFLLSIGLTSKKSLTIKKILVPDAYFYDFLRGYFDGDGCSYSYKDKRWKSSFMFYISFSSGSMDFLEWIHLKLNCLIGAKGHISINKVKKNNIQLKYSKHEAIKVLRKIYYKEDVICLKRKKLKIINSLDIMGKKFI